jgi:hypothetical protein
VKTFECDLCNFKAKYPTILRQHILAVHLGIEKHKCEHSDAFRVRKELTVHVNSVHKKLKIDKCDLCDLKTVHLGIKDFKSHICDNVFSHRTHLKLLKPSMRRLRNAQCDFMSVDNQQFFIHIRKVDAQIIYHLFYHSDDASPIKGDVSKHIKGVY